MSRRATQYAWRKYKKNPTSGNAERLVESLLALGDADRNNQFYEVEAALRKAETLIIKYNLSQYDVKLRRLQNKLADRRAGKEGTYREEERREEQQRRAGRGDWWRERQEQTRRRQQRQEQRQQRAGGRTRARRRAGQTIREFVFSCFDQNPNYSFERMNQQIHERWPDSAFDYSHYRWYKGKWRKSR